MRHGSPYGPVMMPFSLVRRRSGMVNVPPVSPPFTKDHAMFPSLRILGGEALIAGGTLAAAPAWADETGVPAALTVVPALTRRSRA